MMNNPDRRLLNTASQLQWDFLQVGLPRGCSDKTITSSKLIVKLSEWTVSVFLNKRLTKNHKRILVRRHGDFVNGDIAKTADKSSLLWGF